METLQLLEQGALAKAAGNIVASLALCIGATWAGALIARQL
jgi:fluoride ion exporter CrcB/FEX